MTPGLEAEIKPEPAARARRHRRLGPDIGGAGLTIGRFGSQRSKLKHVS